MGLHDRQRRSRNDLAWYLAGFMLVQLALGVGIERFWPAIRDPEVAALQGIVRGRQAEAPGRPLVLCLGSSRTRWGLHAVLLNRPDSGAPLVINSAVPGSGPMMQSVILRRMLKAGMRPELVVVETVPMFVSISDGHPFEENLSAARLTATEGARLRKYLEEPGRWYSNWLRARAFPCYRYAAELRDSLALDVPAAGQQPGLDRYGWGGAPNVLPPEVVAKLTSQVLTWYGTALTEPAVAPGVIQAYRDLVSFARDRNIKVVFVMPPESSALREASPKVTECHARALRDLADECAVPLIDARTWIADDGFWDGSHMTQRGADQYTERFGRDVLAPHAAPGLHWTAAPSADHAF